MKTIKRILLSAVLIGGAWLVASPASAQQGYYDPYQPYSYRSMARGGTYHGYWRDLGYGFNNRGTRGYYLPRYDYYYGAYPPVYPAPVYPAPVYPAPYGYR